MEICSVPDYRVVLIQVGAAVMLVSWSGGTPGATPAIVESVQSEPDPSSFLAFPEAGGINKGEYGIPTQTWRLGCNTRRH